MNDKTKIDIKIPLLQKKSIVLLKQKISPLYNKIKELGKKKIPENILHIPGFTFYKESKYSCNKRNNTIQEYIHSQDHKKSKATGIKFVLIPGGSFNMGMSKLSNSVPIRQVKIKPFLLAKYVVTQGEWKKVMNTEPWKCDPLVKKGKNYPAVYISWEDAKAFCLKTGLTLPSEAQWEYACKSGSKTLFFWGNQMNSDYCWYYENAKKQLHKVGRKKPNAYGLYDMIGNIKEWCKDVWHDTYKGAPLTGKAWIDKTTKIRIERGGSWDDGELSCSSSFRSRHVPDTKTNNIGFRVAKRIP